MCVCIYLLIEDSSWTDHCALFFFPPSATLAGRLQRNWSLGGSREEPGKEGTKGRPSAAITTSRLLSLFPVLPSLGPPSLPSLHWPAPQIKTSDKKMGSLKKERKKREKEREKEVQNKPRGAVQQSLCCWRAGPLCCSARNCHCVNLDPLVLRNTNHKEHTHRTHTQRRKSCCRGQHAHILSYSPKQMMISFMKDKSVQNQSGPI